MDPLKLIPQPDAIPVHWGWFQLLLICTFILHLLFMNTMLGCGIISLIREFGSGKESEDMNRDMSLKLPYTVAFTVNMGVAPLLLTMVFGGLTGVGIWFTIALLNPSATSTLIHTFVFGWATEWVCFLGEIIALFIYFYTFGKLSPERHLKIGWLYFIFAWLSLFPINGIIDFMLTPGRWVQDQSFWSGFFNPRMCAAPMPYILQKIN